MRVKELLESVIEGEGFIVKPSATFNNLDYSACMEESCGKISFKVGYDCDNPKRIEILGFSSGDEKFRAKTGNRLSHGYCVEECLDKQFYHDYSQPNCIK